MLTDFVGGNANRARQFRLGFCPGLRVPRINESKLLFTSSSLFQFIDCNSGWFHYSPSANRIWVNFAIPRTMQCRCRRDAGNSRQLVNFLSHPQIRRVANTFEWIEQIEFG